MTSSTLEVVYLKWVSQGRSLQDIALIEDVPLEEITTHMADAMARFGAKSLREAVKKAKQSTLI